MERVITFGIAAGWLTASACGRLAFVETDGDAGDAPTEPAPCDLTAPFGTPVVIDSLSTPANEGSLRLLPDGLAGYFHSNLDIFRAVRPDLASPFTFSPVNALNTSALEQEPTVTPDDLMIVFRRRVATNDELFYATRSTPAAPFDAPVLITALADINVDSQPFLSPGDGHLYYQSMRDGADQDIYRSAHDGTTFAAPLILEELRASNEGDPVLSFDGLDIYWRTTRAGGLGGFDIWTAHRTTIDEPVFNAISIVANVNSSAEDGPSWLSPDGCHLYLASNRSGNYDLFVASRP